MGAPVFSRNALICVADSELKPRRNPHDDEDNSSSWLSTSPLPRLNTATEEYHWRAASLEEFVAGAHNLLPTAAQ